MPYLYVFTLVFSVVFLPVHFAILDRKTAAVEEQFRHAISKEKHEELTEILCRLKRLSIMNMIGIFVFCFVFLPLCVIRLLSI